jgi:hypothetical protein
MVRGVVDISRWAFTGEVLAALQLDRPALFRFIKSLPEFKRPVRKKVGGRVYYDREWMEYWDRRLGYRKVLIHWDFFPRTVSRSGGLPELPEVEMVVCSLCSGRAYRFSYKKLYCIDCGLELVGEEAIREVQENEV